MAFGDLGFSFKYASHQKNILISPLSVQADVFQTLFPNKSHQDFYLSSILIFPDSGTIKSLIFSLTIWFKNEKVFLI